MTYIILKLSLGVEAQEDMYAGVRTTDAARERFWPPAVGLVGHAVLENRGMRPRREVLAPHADWLYATLAHTP